jgi:hypothetical protein
MSRKHKVMDPNKAYFVAMTIVEQAWIFLPEWKEVVVESLKSCRPIKY